MDSIDVIIERYFLERVKLELAIQRRGGAKPRLFFTVYRMLQPAFATHLFKEFLRGIGRVKADHPNMNLDAILFTSRNRLLDLVPKFTRFRIVWKNLALIASLSTPQHIRHDSIESRVGEFFHRAIPVSSPNAASGVFPPEASFILTRGERPCEIVDPGVANLRQELNERGQGL